MGSSKWHLKLKTHTFFFFSQLASSQAPLANSFPAMKIVINLLKTLTVIIIILNTLMAPESVYMNDLTVPINGPTQNARKRLALSQTNIILPILELLMLLLLDTIFHTAWTHTSRKKNGSKTAAIPSVNTCTSTIPFITVLTMDTVLGTLGRVTTLHCATTL